MDKPTKEQVQALASLFSAHVLESESKITDVEEMLRDLENRIARIRKAHLDNRPFLAQMEYMEMLAEEGKFYLQAA